MPEPSPFAKSLRSPWQWVGAAIIFLLLALIVVAPAFSTNRGLGHNQIQPVQSLHIIGLAMYSYANDNNGKYPTGNSSTEVFQKLIDGGYISDPSMLYSSAFQIPGKREATSRELKPENVCWDVTVPVDFRAPDELPLVFETGYRVKYAPSESAILISAPVGWEEAGTAAFYKSNYTLFLKNDGKPDCSVPHFIPANFDAKGVKYIQLTPDGPLP